MSENGTEALQRAKEILGTQSAIAELVGVTQPHVSHILNTGKPVPAEWCIPLDLATSAIGKRISCHQLRPDLWPEDFEPSREAAA